MEFQSLFIDGEDHADFVNDFVEKLGISTAAPGRVSAQLALDLYVGSFLVGDIDTPRVLQEIDSLEGRRKSGTKNPSKFKKAPLKGTRLLHKHYMSIGIQSIEENVLNERSRTKYRASDEFLSYFQSAPNNDRTKRIFAESLSHALGPETYEKRKQRRALTGEWIIFVEHEGLNYYLCLGKHGGDHEVLRKVKGLPMSEFPFLGETLNLE